MTIQYEVDGFDESIQECAHCFKTFEQDDDGPLKVEYIFCSNECCTAAYDKAYALAFQPSTVH